VPGVADIDIVQPVDGAMRVNFDYGAAGALLDQLTAMARRLGDQTDGRRAAHDEVIVNWEGHYRQEFERAYDLLQQRFNSAAEAAGMGQLQVYQAIGDANDAQRRYNQIAEEARARAAANQPGSPQIPI
jgi:hypothetical protein